MYTSFGDRIFIQGTQRANKGIYGQEITRIDKATGIKRKIDYSLLPYYNRATSSVNQFIVNEVGKYGEFNTWKSILRAKILDGK